MNNEKTYDWTTDYRIVLGSEIPCLVEGKCCGQQWSAWNRPARIPVACPMCGAKITNERKAA
jgi:hypothetical protein